MIYIDNAATSRKKPLCVKMAALKEMFLSANPGRAGHIASMRTAELIEKTREIIRKYFFDGNVVFTKNCTEALNLAIVGCSPDKQVITTVYEHNSVLRPLKRLETQGKIRLTIISPDKNGFVRPLETALETPTSLVVVTARSNVTGETTEIEKLAAITKKKSNALFLSDLAQSAGHDKIRYDNMDMVASSGHKGLMGLQGTGFLLCRKNINLSPLITGGTGTSGMSLLTPKEFPESFEAGTLNAPGIISLGKATEYAFKHADRINAKTERLGKLFAEKIKANKNIKVLSEKNGLVLCIVKGKDSGETADWLSENYGICVRGGLHCAPLIHKFIGTGERGAVRFSFGANNTKRHALLAAKALNEYAR